jgi:hypothetical protein
VSIVAVVVFFRRRNNDNNNNNNNNNNNVKSTGKLINYLFPIQICFHQIPSIDEIDDDDDDDDDNAVGNSQIRIKINLF